MNQVTPTTGLTIEQVDPFDDDAVTAWHEVLVASAEHEVGEHATNWSLPELFLTLREPRKHRRSVLFAGRVEGRTVAAGLVDLPLIDNLNAADLEVHVVPACRRQGIGTRVLERMEALCVEHGRTRLDAMAVYPYDAPTDGAGTAGVEFGRAHGYTCGLGDVQREARLPVPTALLDELAAEAAPHHADYELRTWEGPIPDELVVSWLELTSTLITEAPTGDNDYEQEAVDVEAQRMFEAIMDKQERRAWHTAALDRAGRVVAYTDLVVPGFEPRWVFQWGTMVHREHRGHRLGIAVKAANLRALQDAYAGDAAAAADLAARRLVTWNAEVNAPMIGINERLGFFATARCGELQKKL